QQIDVLDEHDAVVNDNTGKNDDTDGTDQAEGLPRNQVECHHTDHHQRHGQEDDEGVSEGLKEGGHDTKDQDDCQDEDHDHLVEHLAHVGKVTAILKKHLIGERQLLSKQRLDVSLSLTGCIP